MQHKKKLLVAAGGTGGHLFPAQNLARKLKEDSKNQIEFLFVGNELNANPYFDRVSFSSVNVASATPFSKNIFRTTSGIFQILKGIKQSNDLLSQFKPDLIIGFGSFHTFPILFSALWKKHPFVLFEPNCLAGKVNRLFSKKALFTGVQFSQTKSSLFGEIIPVIFPFIEKRPNREEAFAYFGLKSDLFTLLVFGGSQGAAAINRKMGELSLKHPVQVLHFTGSEKNSAEMKEIYGNKGISAKVKAFEPRMDLALSIADFAICRAGASTIAELIAFEVPSLVIPYPFAYKHQQENGQLFQDIVGGGICMSQQQLLSTNFSPFIESQLGRLDKFKENIRSFKTNRSLQSFPFLILHFLRIDSS
ncbi:MAG: UDP-N-acetylglucosamine--N-acetylmuramyl-(pentapeptide) pyrophosphoryl-undecaprenol N-acetylglucosamine transferase [Chlamydiae bacterium]|nr:UDP-N-acetylglucosamine--N-acetylmuramyl-(pentapeptide) pyrophosphoryl-undecaprenol N-acetylglucosamine transferase [Chlamydiota bacterium]